MQTAHGKGTEGSHSLCLNNPFIPPKGVFSFINNLPVEILSRIFHLASADDGDPLEEDDAVGDYWHNLYLLRFEARKGLRYEVEEEALDETEDEASSVCLPPLFPFQIFISHVCCHWRKVALSTPSLWKTVEVCPVAGLSYELESVLLERSRNIPIDVTVDCMVHKVGAEAPSNAEVKPLFSMLVPHVHRWRTLAVTVPDYHHMFMFLNAVSDHSIPAASELTSLKLYHDTEEQLEEGFDPSMSKHFTLFSGSAPLLTQVVLWRVHVDWNQPWIASASSLRELELALHTDDVRPSWTQFSTILRSTTLLQKLTLRRSGPSGDPAEWFIQPTLGSPADLDAPINLSHLTDLVLTLHSQPRVMGLLRMLYLPSLKNMVLILTDGDYTDLVHQLAGPATSLSLPSIREQPHSLLSQLASLRFILPCHPECVEVLYGELQNVTWLDISLWAVPSSFLYTLGARCTLPDKSGVWLPRLETLCVCGATGDALHEVVQSRMDAGVPLSSLYVDTSCEIEEEDLVWLQENVKTFKRTWD